MSDAMTLPASPKTCLLPATRHRVAAISSGLGGLTATKALKHDLANIADGAVFLTRMAAQGTSHFADHTSPLVQVIPATAAAFTTFGVFITLHMAAARGRKRHLAANRNQRRPMDATFATAMERYEVVTAASTFIRNERLWHACRRSKGWF